MSPSNLTFDSADSRLLDSVLISYFSLQSHVASYLSNLLRCQFSKSILLAASRSAVLKPVSLIGGRCIPSKISKAIVSGISVVVATFIALWRKSTERNKNKSMDSNHFWLVIFPEQKVWPPIFFGSGLYLEFARFQRANSPMIGYFIKSLKPNNLLPIFHALSITTCGIKVNGS